MTTVNQHQRAAKAWDILVRVAEQNDFIRYKELGDKIGIHHRAIRFVLALIQDYCVINKLPPLTILIGDEYGMPGKGFTAWDRENIEEGKKQVYDKRWLSLENPFQFALNGQTEVEIINALLENPEESGEIFKKIKTRGTAQIIFRKTLLKAYNSKCAICGISYQSTLQAAHILPWSKANVKQRMDIGNGLLLCANHHSLFDKGHITIEDDYTIFINPKLKQLSQPDRLLTTSFHLKKLTLPKNELWWPVSQFLADHRNRNPIN